MKSILLAMTLATSVATFASTPATESLALLFEAGQYSGSNGTSSCKVNVQIQHEKIVVTIQNVGTSETFTLKNNHNDYSVNEETGEISASQSLNFPNYLRGGTKVLNLRPITKWNEKKVEFFISNILIDHRDNDLSTFFACTVLL